MGLGRRRLLVAGWIGSVGLAVGVRAWNAIFGPLFYGYDAWGHIAYVFFLDMYRALPYADQGWSYFHPPLHYLFGWALMQLDDPVGLVVGISLLGSAFSLGTAALGAYVAHRYLPERRGMTLLAFTSLAFLPVHLYTSPMPGNEMTATFFAAAAFAAHLRNETRPAPSLRADAMTGILGGLALLSKFTSTVPALAIGAVTALRWMRSGAPGRGLPRFAARGAALAVPMFLIAGPFYARNVAEFGTPFATSASFPDVARIQASQPPGTRSWIDFVQISPKLLEESTGDAPHMIHSVWSNAYLNVWFDSYRESQLPLPGFPIRLRFIHQLTVFFGCLGLLPTLVAFFGALLAARRAWKEPDAAIDLGMTVLAFGTLAAFVIFAIEIPTWAALKASYLLNLSLPFAFFLVRGTVFLARRDPWLGAIPPVAIAAVAIAATVTFTTGGLMRRHFDSLQMASIDAHFGDFESTRQLFHADAPQRSYVEARAAVELLAGNPSTARRYYQRAGEMEMEDPAQLPYYENRLAVATALDHMRGRALELLDEALADSEHEELLVNRGAIRAVEGDLEGAEADLRRALALAPHLPPAWSNLAVVLERLGREDAAAEARAEARDAADRPPRGFPYGVGTGYLYDSGAGQRWMLLLVSGNERKDGDPTLRLALYHPPRSRAVRGPANP